MEDFFASLGPIENALIGLWIAASGDVHIDANTSVFSLAYGMELASRLQRDIERVFQVSLPENSLHNYPTPRQLARVVFEAGALKNDALPPVTRVPRDQPIPLSYSQERMWFVYQLDKESTAYNVGGVTGVRGPLKREALQKSLNAVVRRHEMLRTVFPLEEGSPVQKILPYQECLLQWVDLSGFPLEERKTRALELANEYLRVSFDLENRPPFLLCVIELEPEDHLLVLNLHHIIVDAWSLALLTDELIRYYGVFSRGEALEIAEPVFQYADYAAWQRQVLAGERLERQLAYWRKKLEAITPLELPTTFPRPAVQRYRGGVVNMPIPADLFGPLQRLGQEGDATLFMASLAVFYTLLYRYAGQADLSIAVPIANRNFTAAESMLGTLVNTLILRVDAPGGLAFRELLRRVRQASLEAFDHQDMPYARLVADLQPERDASRSPLAQIMFNMVNVPFEARAAEGLETYEVAYDRQGVQFDLTLHIYQGRLQQLSLEYNADLFDRAAMERLMGHYLQLVRSVLSAPDTPISGLEMLTPAERQQFEMWNDTATPYPAGQTILHLFEQQARRTPRQAAFQQGGVSLTYADLNARANQLARYLQQAGVAPGAAVGLCIRRSLNAATALIAILKAGAAYVPIDPNYPLQRQEYMLKDCGARVVVGMSATLGALAQHCEHPILLDQETAAIDRQSPQDLPNLLAPESPLYILYTSGSTGQPKGVVGTHRAALNRFSWMWQVVPYEPGEISCQRAALSFVDSVWEVFGPLLQGIPNVIIPDEVGKDPSALVAELSLRKVTRIVMVPSLLRAILDTAANLDQKLPHLNVVDCASEALPVELVRRFYQALPRARLLNLYGSSEDAGDVTWYDTRDLPENAASVPIGRPIYNTTAYVLDAHLNQVPTGIPGEITIGGANLAAGYHNRPDLTAERFIPDPFHPGSGARLFRTGDLGSFQPDGNIAYIGRRDHQVKLRGMRIELEEVENALAQHPGVQECRVLLVDQGSSNQVLAAYIVPRYGGPAGQGGGTRVEELRSHLRQKLPDYMIPDRFVTLERLPLNPTGKLDRAALPSIDSIPLSREKLAEPPRDPLEQQMIATWEEILEVRPVGREDNFFDLGGHSLLAVRLVSRIEKEMGIKIPVMLLFQEPAVAGFAAAVRQGAQEIEWRTIVPIHPQGSLPPFFCVHGFAGGVPGYAALARSLAPDQPFYGLQARGLDGKTPPAESVEEMAANYIRSIQDEVQPRGPYFLGGYCFGGLVAYEMARQLAAQGEPVALVALFETYPEQRFARPWRNLLPRNSRAFLRNLPHWLAEEKGRRQRMREQLGRWTSELEGAPAELRGIDLGGELIDPSALIYPGFSGVVAAHLRASRAYRTSPYPGRVDIFRVLTHRLSAPPDRDLGWSRYAAGGAEIHIIPGAHDNFLDPPHVEGLAAALNASLEKAREVAG